MEEIVTGEAVILGLPSARFPTRILAFLINMVVEIAALGVIAVLAAVGEANHGLDTASGAAVLIAGFVLVIVGYPVAFEALSRGRTLGKLALGLRVVADDGGPERFRQALVRALAGTIEIWALIGVPALVRRCCPPGASASVISSPAPSCSASERRASPRSPTRGHSNRQEPTRPESKARAARRTRPRRRWTRAAAMGRLAGPVRAARSARRVGGQLPVPVQAAERGCTRPTRLAAGR